VCLVAHAVSYAPLLLLSVNEPLALGLWLVAAFAGLAVPLTVWKEPNDKAQRIIAAWHEVNHQTLIRELDHEARIAHTTSTHAARRQRLRA